MNAICMIFYYPVIHCYSLTVHYIFSWVARSQYLWRMSLLEQVRFTYMYGFTISCFVYLGFGSSVSHV